MEELVEFIERTPKATMAKHWKDMLHTLPSPLAEVIKPKSWKHIYSMSAVNSALSNIQMVGYDQKLVSCDKQIDILLFIQSVEFISIFFRKFPNKQIHVTVNIH